MAQQGFTVDYRVCVQCDYVYTAVYLNRRNRITKCKRKNDIPNSLLEYTCRVTCPTQIT